MSANVRVTQLSFETPVTNEFANVLDNVSQSQQTIDEQIISIAYIRVTALNLEVPVAVVAVESLTNVQQSVQEIDETIVGTPVPVVEPGGVAPAAFVGAGAKINEELENVCYCDHELDEYVYEEVVTIATSEQSLDTLIYEKTIYEVPRTRRPLRPVTQKVPETVKFEGKQDSVVISERPISREKLRQKEEDELLLLGVLG